MGFFEENEEVFIKNVKDNYLKKLEELKKECKDIEKEFGECAAEERFLSRNQSRIKAINEKMSKFFEERIKELKEKCNELEKQRHDKIDEIEGFETFVGFFK